MGFNIIEILIILTLMIFLMKIILKLLFMLDLCLDIIDLNNAKHVKKEVVGISKYDWCLAGGRGCCLKGLHQILGLS